MFYSPEETFLAEPETVKALAELLKESDESVRAEADILAGSLKETEKQELILDYSALFVGPFQLQAPPYGSVYLDLAKTVNGESTAAVTEIYRSFGLDVDDSMKEPADHIAIELEFLHTVIIAIGNMKAEGADTDAAEDTAEAFISVFFRPFVLQMCDLMVKNSTTAFYRSLGKLLSDFAEKLTVLEKVTHSE